MSLGPVLNESFVQDFTTNIQQVQENSYLAKTKNLVYPKFSVTRTTNSQREVFAWLLSTARLRHEGQGGMGEFESMSMAKLSMSVGNFAMGVEFRENQFTDLDGQGVQLATKWNADAAAEIAYHPQRELAALLMYGETGLSFDNVAYFSKSHPNHPKDLSRGTYSNLLEEADFAGTPNLSLRPDLSTPEERLNALTVIKTHLSKIKMPNGKDFRKLKLGAILHAPALGASVAQLQSAKFIAQVTASAGAGSGDIESVIRYQGLGEPIEMEEIGATASYEARVISATDDSETVATVTGSDDSYYVIAREEVASEIPGMIWLVNEPVAIQFFNRFNAGGLEAAKKRRMWFLAQGRATASYGMPYHIFKVKPRTS
jgi:hypothetical protein